MLESEDAADVTVKEPPVVVVVSNADVATAREAAVVTGLGVLDHPGERLEIEARGRPVPLEEDVVCDEVDVEMKVLLEVDVMKDAWLGEP